MKRTSVPRRAAPKTTWNDPASASVASSAPAMYVGSASDSSELPDSAKLCSAIEPTMKAIRLRGPMVFAPRSLIAFMVGSIALHSFAESGSSLLSEADPTYMAGALLATLALAGSFQVVFGAARLGTLVRFIPAPVMAGFQNAASLLILYSQIHVLLGLPKRLPPAALPAALADAKLLNLLLGAATIAVIWNGARISR